MKKTILFSLMLVGMSAFSEKWPRISDQDEIIKTARAELDTALMAPEGELYLFATENNIQGTYIFKISIREKGRVASVNIVERKQGEIKDQNRLKDAVMDYRFGFKMPKGRIYKFEYEFSFN